MSSKILEYNSKPEAAFKENQDYSGYTDLMEETVANEEILPDNIVVSGQLVEEHASEIEEHIKSNVYGAISLEKEELKQIYNQGKSKHVKDYHADFDLKQSFNYGFGAALGKVIRSETEELLGDPDIESAIEIFFENEDYDYLRDSSMLVMKRGAYVTYDGNNDTYEIEKLLF